MSGYASSLENIGEADNVRQQRKGLQSRRLARTITNRELAKITADRKFVGGVRARVEERVVGGGGGLPDQRAFKQMREMGKTLSGGSMRQKVPEETEPGVMEGGRTRMTKAEMKKRQEKAVNLGKMYGSELKKQDPEVQELVGSGFLKDFGRGFGLGAGEEMEMEMVEEKPTRKRRSKKTGGMATGGMATGGKRTRRKASVGDKRKKRGAMISRLMKTEGMSLGQASKYIKENGLMD